jgi:hypothetical protein
MKIGLVGCCYLKSYHATQAQYLYQSNLFLKSRDYIKQNCQSWMILSAKHGLVMPTEILEPYNKTLTDLRRSKRMEWADEVWVNLEKVVKKGDEILILAGRLYWEFLITKLMNHGCQVEIPFRHLQIGQQLHWLDEHLGAKV